MMSSVQTNIAIQPEIDSAGLAALCKHFGVRWLAVFGSVARGEARPDSDVDVLYELRPGQVMGYITLDNFAEALRAFLAGRPIDIARASQLHWLFRDRVLAEAKVIYEE